MKTNIATKLADSFVIRDFSNVQTGTAMEPGVFCDDHAGWALTPIAPRPIVKWAGGKRQLLQILNTAAPPDHGRYFEPFLGGGALFFSRRPDRATVSDANPELVNCYLIVRDQINALMDDLATHKNDEKYFYSIRAKNPAEMSEVARAGRFIYLNKTCFNGLYRENSEGKFNCPFGRYLNPTILDRSNLIAVHSYLKNADIRILCRDYREVATDALAGDFVYFDPPYNPLTTTASFTKYLRSDFGEWQQRELAALFRELTRKGVLAMLSNSNTQLIHDLYRGFDIHPIKASRSINCKGTHRGRQMNEVIIRNY